MKPFRQGLGDVGETFGSKQGSEMLIAQQASQCAQQEQETLFVDLCFFDHQFLTMDLVLVSLNEFVRGERATGFVSVSPIPLPHQTATFNQATDLDQPVTAQGTSFLGVS